MTRPGPPARGGCFRQTSPPLKLLISPGPAVPGHSGQPSVESVGIRASPPAEMRVGAHQHDLCVGVMVKRPTETSTAAVGIVS
jgi:hypothetical protein